MLRSVVSPKPSRLKKVSLDRKKKCLEALREAKQATGPVPGAAKRSPGRGGEPAPAEPHEATAEARPKPKRGAADAKKNCSLCDSRERLTSL